MNTRTLVVWFVCGAWASTVHAQPDTTDSVNYRVKQGDSAELVAAEFYGDRAYAELVLAANKLPHPHPLRPGERIKVPVTRRIVTVKGDSLDSLAATYLGDARRAPFLAEFNGMAIDDAPHLPVGVELAIPIQVPHTAAANESLANIATLYYGDAKQAALIRKYNYLDKAALDKGESVLVPMTSVRVRESRLPPLDADAKTRFEQRLKAVELAALVLPRARAAWAQGDFAGVRSALGHVLEDIDCLDAGTAVDVALLMGRADVAFDEVDPAVAALAQVLDRKPRYTLSPYTESPKLIAAWKQAGGHVEGEP